MTGLNGGFTSLLGVVFAFALAFAFAFTSGSAVCRIPQSIIRIHSLFFTGHIPYNPTIVLIRVVNNIQDHVHLEVYPSQVVVSNIPLIYGRQMM